MKLTREYVEYSVLKEAATIMNERLKGYRDCSEYCSPGVLAEITQMLITMMAETDVSKEVYKGFTMTSPARQDMHTRGWCELNEIIRENESLLDELNERLGAQQ